MKTTRSKSTTRRSRPSGKNFLAEAREQHAALFAEFAELEGDADEFGSPDEFLGELEAASWEFTEKLAKQSWRNGIARGEARKSPRRSAL